MFPLTEVPNDGGSTDGSSYCWRFSLTEVPPLMEIPTDLGSPADGGSPIDGVSH